MADSDDLEWEEWDPSKLSFMHHVLAGSVAGLAEHVCMFPMDTVKTHVQCERCGSTSPMKTLNCAARIVNREGVFRLWRGVSAMFAGCIPAHAAYFSVFEAMKEILGAGREGHHPIASALCGAAAAFSHDLFMTPFDVVKQRMQIGLDRTTLSCLRNIIKVEGIGALYVSMPTTLMMNIPYGCIMVPVNESVRKILNPKGEYDVKSSMIAGCTAGAIAAACTNPLDVVKTRLQTGFLNEHPRALHVDVRESEHGLHRPNLSVDAVRYYHTADAVGKHVNYVFKRSLRDASTSRGYTTSFVADFSMVRAATKIFREEGWIGFTRGMLPRVLVQAPAVAISWTTYESMKKLLALNSHSSTS